MVITDKAKLYIEAILTEHNVSSFRVVFAGMGWGGPKLGLALDEAEETDQIKVINGLTVAIDELVAPYIADIVLDCQTNEFGKEALKIIGMSDC